MLKRNLALEHEGSSRGLPCDFGSMADVTEAGTRALLKKFFAGFHYQIEQHYQAKVVCSADFLYARSHCTATIDDEALRVMTKHISDVARPSSTSAGREERLGFQPVVPAFNRGLSGLSPFVVKPVGGFQPRGSTAFSLRSTFPGFQPPTVNPTP